MPGEAGPVERVIIVRASVIVRGAAFFIALAFPGTKGEPIAKAVAALAATVTFLYAYFQWRAARHGSSFAKSYDRLEIANRRFDAARLEEVKSGRCPASLHLYAMFVYAEIDNPEYILGKYRLRYVRPDLAERAIRHSGARCKDGQFRQTVREVMDDGQAGYEATTADAVARIMRANDPALAG